VAAARKWIPLAGTDWWRSRNQQISPQLAGQTSASRARRLDDRQTSAEWPSPAARDARADAVPHPRGRRRDGNGSDRKRLALWRFTGTAVGTPKCRR